MKSSLKKLIGEEDLARVRQPLAHAWTLPPVAYTSPAVFAAEADAMFAHDWICVARVDQLAEPGDYICADLPGQPIVVSRDAQGDLHAISRVCLHRAMLLVDEDGHGTRFTCPYHKWTYELDGRLRSAPMMEGAVDFDVRDCHLPTLRVEVWEGFIFVNADDSAAPLAPRLVELKAIIEGYDIGGLEVADTIEFDSPWNWKVLVENFMEAYHHIGTHQDTFEPVYPARDSSVEDNHGAPWMLLRMPGNQQAAEDDLPPLPGLTEQQRRELLAIAVFPTLLFAASGSLVFWYQLEPHAHDRMRLRIHVLLPAALRNALGPDDIAQISEGVRFVHLQDIEVNAGPWRGLQARLTRQGRLSPYEKAIWQLNQRWADELGL